MSRSRSVLRPPLVLLRSPSPSRSGPSPRWGGPERGERGSVIPFLALLIVAVGGLCLGLGRLGGDAVAAAQAQTAADAAALAGAAEGESAAREVAGANGAELVAFVAEGPEVQVRARVDDAEAVARATRATVPSTDLPGGPLEGPAGDP